MTEKINNYSPMKYFNTRKLRGNVTPKRNSNLLKERMFMPKSQMTLTLHSVVHDGEHTHTCTQRYTPHYLSIYISFQFNYKIQLK